MIKNKSIISIGGMMLLSALVFLSCGSKNSEFYDYGSEGLQPEVEYIFYPFDSLHSHKADLSSKELLLLIRYSELCDLKELPLSVEWSSLEQDSVRECKIKVPLFNQENTYIGKGNFGIFETTYPLMVIDKPQEGLYISLSTQEKETKGILSLGVTCK